MPDRPAIVESILALARTLNTSVVAEGIESGTLHRGVAPDELAAYCLHALGAATELTSTAAVRRLVDVTLRGLGAPT